MLKELREKQARILTNARAKLDEITDSTPAERAAEIEREYDAMMGEHDQIGARCDRLERQERAERALNAPDARRPVGQDTRANLRDDAAPPAYRDVFFRMLSLGGEVSELTPEERQVLRQGAVELRAQTAGTNSAGGYTVPVEMASFIDRAMLAYGPMYDEAICTVLNTSTGNSIKIPTVNDTTVTAVAHTEGAALTDDGGSDVTFGQKSLDSFGFDTEFVRFSLELARDSAFNVEQVLGTLLAERLGRIANAQLTTGSGSSAPNGIVTASSVGVTAASTTAVTSDEIIDLLHSVDPAYRMSPKARFMFNDATLAAIRKLKDGQGNYLWQMGDVSKGQPGTLLGYNYSVNQGMASLGAGNKVMLFGDFGKYYVRKVGGMTLGVLRERFWPDLGIAGLIYFDGEIGQSAAIKHLKNAAS